jgi:RNA polymerase sigma-70 factor (ECF subfamily)
LQEEGIYQTVIRPKMQNEAFQKSLVNLSKPLYNHIRNIILNHDDTNDVLQNTFIKVFQNLKKFKEKTVFLMYRIATNEALNF